MFLKKSIVNRKKWEPCAKEDIAHLTFEQQPEQEAPPVLHGKKQDITEIAKNLHQ